MHNLIIFRVWNGPWFLKPLISRNQGADQKATSWLLANIHVPFLFTTLFTKNEFRNFLQTCSWHQKNETTNSPIYELKVLHKGKRALLKPLFNDLLFLIYYFKNHFKPYFLILEALKDILQHFNFENWWIRSFVFLMSRTG